MRTVSPFGGTSGNCGGSDAVHVQRRAARCIAGSVANDGRGVRWADKPSVAGVLRKGAARRRMWQTKQIMRAGATPPACHSSVSFRMSCSCYAVVWIWQPECGRYVSQGRCAATHGANPWASQLDHACRCSASCLSFLLYSIPGVQLFGTRLGCCAAAHAADQSDPARGCGSSCPVLLLSFLG